jgi:hypothetical protein
MTTAHIDPPLPYTCQEQDALFRDANGDDVARGLLRSMRYTHRSA